MSELTPGTEAFVENSAKLTSHFGGTWPCFHDAEVVDLHFWRGSVRPGDWDDRNFFPKLTLKIQILEATQPGAKHAGNDVMATFRFHDVEDFQLRRFDHMNSFVGLSIGTQDRGKFLSGEPLPPHLVVDLQGFVSFRCFRIQVLKAVPFKDPWQ